MKKNLKEKNINVENVDKSVLEFLEKKTIPIGNIQKIYGDFMISVIITTYNRSELLLRAINSVFAQSYGNIEVIVVDDNSTDNTMSILKKIELESPVPFSYLKNLTNLGPSTSRKNGLEIATGRYVIFMDDDDYYCNQNVFLNAMDIFTKYRNLSFVAGNSFLEYEENKELEYHELNVKGYIKSIDYFKEMSLTLDKPRSTFSSIFTMRSIIDSKANKMEMFNDSSIYLRSLMVGDAYIDSDIWGVYFVHKNNISKTISSKFIVQNLEEKYKMTLDLVENEEITSKWLIAHFKMTILYFFSGSNINDLDILLDWIEKQKKIKVRYIMKKMLYNQLLKMKLKRILKR